MVISVEIKQLPVCPAVQMSSFRRTFYSLLVVKGWSSDPYMCMFVLVCGLTLYESQPQ